jgi:hypoxanthine phosphoribosyltransferase
MVGTMDSVDPNKYLQYAELIHSKQEVQATILSIADQLNQVYANDAPIVLCVMNGGAVFSGQLLPQLTFPLEFDYVQATRYHETTEGKHLIWIIKPNNTVKNRNVLILDDILDEGITLKAIVDECLMLGANEVKVAVLVEKQLNKVKSMHADYVGLRVPNRYVFGCGMDVCGWWRNLPSIYALRDF